MQTTIILSGKEHIAFLMHRDIHSHNGHTELSFRSPLRPKINRCFDCRRQNASAMQLQMAPLPDFRISSTQNFIV